MKAFSITLIFTVLAAMLPITYDWGVVTERTFYPQYAFAATDIINDGTLSANLVSCWELDETSGTRVDAVTASGNDLTDNNTVLFQTGVIGNGADFERSTTEYLSITDAAQTGLDITGTLTIVAWVNLESTPGDMWIATKGDIAASTRSVSYYFGTNGGSDGLQTRMSDDGTINSGHTVVQTANSGFIGTGTWAHVAAVFRPATDDIVIYINGVNRSNTKSGTLTATTINNSDDRFALGERKNGASTSGNFDGIMDVVAVFDTDLTSTDIGNLYASGAGIPCDAGGGGGGTSPVQSIFWFGLIPVNKYNWLG